MALSYANVSELIRVEGPGADGYSVIRADITLDASYATGGYAGIKAGLGVTSSARSIQALSVGSSAGLAFDYDRTNDKLKVYTQPGTAAVGAMPEATTNLAALNGKVVTVVAHVV